MEKYFDFKCNNKLFEKYEMFIPNIEKRLNNSENTENIKAIEVLTKHKLPKIFMDLYSQFDGEKDDSYLDMILGFSLMSTKDILNTIHNFNSMNFEIMSMNTGVIKDEKISDKILIPFAFDGSRCYIALDMSPDKDGREGQVVTIDFDYDKSYLISDSLDEFYKFIYRMFDSGKFFTSVDEDEETYFEFESGHFFNNLDDILDECKDDLEEVQLSDEFLKQY